ncbi:MAG: ATP-binding protein, partial [Chloroflexota bacterium]
MASFCSSCGATLTATSAVASGGAQPAGPTTAPNLEAHLATVERTLPTALREQLFTQPEGENRILTILFADLSASVGSTRSLHPEANADLVNTVFQAMVDAILEFGGRINRLMGDEVLAFFGTPQAHENDPERAILAALKLRESVQRLGMSVHAGINSGEVYLGSVGATQHQEFTAMGTAINLAARLCSQAEPGQILVGEAVYRPTRRAFEFLPHTMQVKGIAEPVTAYEVVRRLPRPEKLRGIEGLRAELIGREEELTKLRAALADVQRGEGHMVSIIGEAGVGKSRLIGELKDLTQTPDQQTAPMWLEGRCLDLGASVGYWPFIDLLRSHFGFTAEDDERGRGERLAAVLRQLVEQGDLSPARLEEVAPLLGNLLSVRFGDAWDEQLQHADPEQVKHRTFLAIRDLLTALAKRRPLVLVLEDLHWADSLSLDLIPLLMETLTQTPLLLVCTYRPEREHKCWHLALIAVRKCGGRYSELPLHELTPPQSRRLVEALLQIEALPAATKGLILQQTQGNPFFVEEVVRSLIDSGAVYQEGEVWRARPGVEALQVPDSVQSVILCRVDRLAQDVRQVLQSAAVIGRLFRRRLLAQVTRQEQELERALWELEDRALIYEERAIPEAEYSFQHFLTQQSVYQNILRRRRAVFHREVAEAMEELYRYSLDDYCEQLAHHYDQAGVGEKAVAYLLQAGEKARRAYLNDEAIRFFRRALERLQDSDLGAAHTDWQVAALRGLGTLYLGIGNLDEADTALRRAIALGKEHGLPASTLVHLYHWLGEVLFWQGQMSEERIALGEAGLALVGADAQSVEAAIMNAMLAFSYQNQGNIDKWNELCARNAAFLQRLPYSEPLRACYAHIIQFYSGRKDLAEAERWVRTLEQLAEREHDRRALGGAQQYMGMIAINRGNLAAALSHLHRALERYTSIDDVKHGSQACMIVGNLSLQGGDLTTAEEYLLRALDQLQTIGYKRFLLFTYRSLATLALCQGAPERARAAASRAQQLSSELQSLFKTGSTLLLGRVYLALGERQEAVRCFEEAARSAQRLPPGAAYSQLEPAALAGLEAASFDDGAFRAAGTRLRLEVSGSGPKPLLRWRFEPAQPERFGQQRVQEPFGGPDLADWQWHDPFGDCSFATGQGLELRAANGRDLLFANQSAPRLLRPAVGDFAAQTVCAPLSEAQPAIGGLLLWQDQEHYLVLERGRFGRDDLVFRGCLGNDDRVIGRGRLPGERLLLRLERRGSQVRALCSVDGDAWHSVGEAAFLAELPVEVGLCAIGAIDRSV